MSETAVKAHYVATKKQNMWCSPSRITGNLPFIRALNLTIWGTHEGMVWLPGVNVKQVDSEKSKRVCHIVLR